MVRLLHSPKNNRESEFARLKVANQVSAQTGLFERSDFNVMAAANGLFIFSHFYIYVDICHKQNVWSKEFMSRNVRKRTFGHVHPAKIQISLRIGAVWSESSLSGFWIANDATLIHADNEDPDQTARMRRLIWVIAGRTSFIVVFCLALVFDNIINPN